MFRVLAIILMFLFFGSEAFCAQATRLQALQEGLDKSQKMKCLVFATSWCEDCIKQLKSISKIHKKHKSSLELIIISLDREPKKLKGLSKSLGGQNTFYDLSKEQLSLFKWLKDIGITFRGGLPHTTLLSHDNSIIADGNFKPDSIEQGIITLK